MINVNTALCIGCGVCENICPFNAIVMVNGLPVIQDNCTFCNTCSENCPVNALKGEDTQSENADLASYQGIWVVGLENREDILSKPSMELLSEAVRLARHNNLNVTLVVPGNMASKAWITSAGSVGCNEILLLSGNRDQRDFDFRTGAVVQAIRAKKPEVVLFPASADGRDLAPKVACRLQTGLTADCTGLEMDEDGNLLQIRPTYGGSIMATIKTPTIRPQMASVRPNVMKVVKQTNPTVLKTEIFMVADEPEYGRIQYLYSEAKNSSFGDLEEAAIVVAGGYGMGSKENFQKIFKLCEKLNATAAATRKAIDEGWAPIEIQVGQTGKTVAPDLYIAFGVSGALQHSLGMNNSKRIVAVNNDPAAQIFSICDVAILGDAAAVIDEMCSRLDKGELLF